MEKISCVVVAIPNTGIPVFKVQRKSGDSIIKTLHKNMLHVLPFSAISNAPDIPAQSNKNVESN